MCETLPRRSVLRLAARVCNGLKLLVAAGVQGRQGTRRRRHLRTLFLILVQDFEGSTIGAPHKARYKVSVPNISKAFPVSTAALHAQAVASTRPSDEIYEPELKR